MTFPSERQAVTTILTGFTLPTIVELGAHEGEDMEWMLEAVGGKPARAVMIEADHINFMKLVTRGLPGKHYYRHGAIADHDGTCDFWECRDSGGGFGSIYPPLEGLSVSAAQFKKAGPIPCFTFDRLFDDARLATIDLLWADIHGAEKDMIAFGQKALARTRYMFVECFDTPVYEGMATKAELLAALPGWTVIETFPWNMLLHNDLFKEQP